MLRISYFAWVRERMGTGDETIAASADLVTVSDLLSYLSNRDDRGAAAFADPRRIRAAVDGQMVGLDHDLQGACEIALFPPVTGG